MLDKSFHLTMIIITFCLRGLFVSTQNIHFCFENDGLLFFFGGGGAKALISVGNK